jgi:hypothetical protein
MGGLTMPFSLDMEQLVSTILILSIILSRQAERLVLQREERVILRVKELLLMVNAEGLGTDLKDLLVTTVSLLCSSFIWVGMGQLNEIGISDFKKEKIYTSWLFSSWTWNESRAREKTFSFINSVF